MKIINHIRSYEHDHTEGTLYVDQDRFCHVLEDVGRPVGVKIKAETCIPEGVYSVAVTRSTRFKKDMILLYNQKDQTVSRFGADFSGVRAHGGNNVDDTEGCPLLNYHTDSKGSQWGRASDDLCAKIVEWIDGGHDVKWVISSI